MEYPNRVKAAKKLISADLQSNTYNYKVCSLLILMPCSLSRGFIDSSLSLLRSHPYAKTIWWCSQRIWQHRWGTSAISVLSTKSRPLSTSLIRSHCKGQSGLVSLSLSLPHNVDRVVSMAFLVLERTSTTSGSGDRSFEPSEVPRSVMRSHRILACWRCLSLLHFAVCGVGSDRVYRARRGYRARKGMSQCPASSRKMLACRG